MADRPVDVGSRRAASAVERVVVLRPGALGDALLALPALAALRRRGPAAHITLVARADVLPLALGCGLVDAVYPFDLPAWAALWRDPAAPARREALLGQVVAGADAVVAWLSDPDGMVGRNLRALEVRRVVVAPGRPSGAQDGPAALYLLRSLAALGLDDLPTTVGELARRSEPLDVGPQAQQEAQAVLLQLGLPEHRVVAIHPGSGGAAKRWPPDHFAEITHRLRQAGYMPLLVEGPADIEVVSQMRGAAGHPGVPVARGMAVEVLAALLTHCAGYLGNDSGVTHLSALVGTPTLALFGPSDPSVWMPIGRHVWVLRATRPEAEGQPPQIGSLAVSAVWDALLRTLADGRCGRAMP